MQTVINEIRHFLATNGDEDIRTGTRRFFKEEVKPYGFRSADIEKLTKDKFKEIKHLPKAEIFALCENLWQSGYMEEAFIACGWAYSLRKQFTESDFATFERWVDRYVTNWAACDTLCNHTVGTFIEMYPRFLSALKRWTASPNRWMRRASAVSLIIPARRGLFHSDIFEIADLLLTDSDDMVQKGYGWMLKAASQADEQSVFDFVMARRTTMPRTSLRYAIEKMSPEHRTAAMARP